MYLNTGSGDIDIFWSKVNIWNVNCVRATTFIFVIHVPHMRDLTVNSAISELLFSCLVHYRSLWLYVFSSFPPPRPRPRPRPPPPQWLLLLTSKPFELHLRYLGQRKYRSGKMYLMTFRWPWPKVMAVTLINTNLLVCRIKWEPLN